MSAFHYSFLQTQSSTLAGMGLYTKQHQAADK